MRRSVLFALAWLLSACATVRPEPVSGAIGTSGPVIVTAVSAVESWVAFCQARKDTNRSGSIDGTIWTDYYAGDALDSFFVDGATGNLGMPIDAWIGSDPSGRWVAFVRGGALLIRDTIHHTERDLSTRGAIQLGDEPTDSVSFDPKGERLLYLRERAENREAVLLNLRNGEEVPLPVGRNVESLGFDPTGDWLLEHPGAGRIPDVRHFTRVDRGDGHFWWVNCNPRNWHFFIADRPPKRATSILDPKIRFESPVFGEVGDALLFKDAPGALWSIDPHGRTSRWMPGGCRSLVLSTNPALKTVALNCMGDDRLRILKARKQTDFLFRVGYDPKLRQAEYRRPGDFSSLPPDLRSHPAPVTRPAGCPSPCWSTSRR